MGVDAKDLKDLLKLGLNGPVILNDHESLGERSELVKLLQTELKGRFCDRYLLSWSERVVALDHWVASDLTVRLNLKREIESGLLVRDRVEVNCSVEFFYDLFTCVKTEAVLDGKKLLLIILSDASAIISNWNLENGAFQVSNDHDLTTLDWVLQCVLQNGQYDLLKALLVCIDEVIIVETFEVAVYFEL